MSHVRAVDGIFQVVRAFDDDEIIHVEGDVNPLRDMEIIQTELRLKDIEWVEKHLDGLKKTGRSLGSTSLADKARKEEIVSGSTSFEQSQFLIRDLFGKATVEKVLKTIKDDQKDVRKAEWTNKEVSTMFSIFLSLCSPSCPIFFLFSYDDKEHTARITQLVEEGVTPQYSSERVVYSDLPFLVLTLHPTVFSTIC